MSVNTVIVEKKYKKLVIQIALDGFSYCIFDTLNHRVDFVNSVDFADYPKTNNTEEHYCKAFLDHQELTRIYDEVLVIHQNSWNTFVPQALFESDFLGNYLQFNNQVFETDFFMFDTILNYEMNNVYVPFTVINNYLLDQFDHFDYKHANSVLVEKLLDFSANNDEIQVFVHFEVQKFQIVIVQNQKLLLFNNFDFQTKEDFIYYLLFTAEQLNLNPEHFKLQFLGDISPDGDLFEIAFKYVRHVSMFDVSEMSKNNGFSTVENLKHFILFQA